MISNAPEKVPTNQLNSPLTLQHSQQSSNATLNRNNSSTHVITAPLNGVSSDQGALNHSLSHQQQQSQIIANIENNSINFDLDDDGYSQISFKHHLRQDEGNSSRGSLHNVYDNMSISTTNTSATTRNADTDSNFLKIVPGLQEVQEAESEEKKVESARTSMFVENSDILNDQNYPKLYYRHSTMLLPTTAKTSRLDDEVFNEALSVEKRRYSDTKLLNSLHFENEFLVKKPQEKDFLGSPTKNVLVFDQGFEVNIRNILELDASNEPVKEPTDDPSYPPAKTEILKEKRNMLFKSLPNLEIS